MSIDRLSRVDSLLRRVIAEGMYTIMNGAAAPASCFTVTAVRCGKDLRDATVSVSVFGDDAFKRRAIRQLQSRARDFQQLINRQVRMKFTPRLTFKLDYSLERGDAVLELLDKLPASGENGESDSTADA